MITKSAEKIEVQEKESAYETGLFQKLKVVRRELADAENVPAYIVLSDATLIELATYLPHTKEEFSKISGFGQVKIERYGKVFWEIVAAYCREHKLHSRIHLKVPKRQRKEKRERDTDTKQQSFELFKQGYSIKEIAEQRNFSLSTVEGHLAFYVEQGKLAIGDVMDVSRIPAIQQAIKKSDGTTLSPIKEALGEHYSYGEIKMVMAHLKNEETHNQ